MNTPNPLLPQGALEGQAKSRSNVHIAIVTIVSIHAVFFAGLLMQGCRRDETKATAQVIEADTNQNTLPPLESEYYPATQDVAQVLTPAPPTPALNSQTGYESAPTTFPAVTADVPLEMKTDTVQGKPYTILKGDNLSKIAKAHGVSLSALTRANPDVDPSRLKPGTQIVVPPTAAATRNQEIGRSEPLKPISEAKVTGTYRVKSGDTLGRIARRHGVTVKAIKTANNLRSDRVIAGQRLKIPVRAGNASLETAKSSVASKLAVSDPGYLAPSETYAR